MPRKQRSVAIRELLFKVTTPMMRRQLLTLWGHMLVIDGTCREMVGMVGALPDFIIIGAQKSGTTYLYDELIKHPFIVPAYTKEIHFFDTYFHKGIAWYRALFPRFLQNGSRRKFITGEASPSYIFHPHATQRVFKIVPHVKLLVLLRNPASRAYSHYQHEVRLGFETLSFREALEVENERLFGEKEKMLEDETYYSHNYMHYSYLTRGIYAEQLNVWSTIFPKEQMMIIKSEHFFRDTPSIMKQIIDFLELPDWNWEEQRGKPKNFPYYQMDTNTRQYLLDYFRPHNQRLYEYLGLDLGWDSWGVA